MKTLYHYTSYRSLLKILESTSLRFGLLEKTNDPKEYLEHSLIFTGNKPLDSIELYNYWISEEINKYKLLCFSVDATIPGFSHPRMWAQYADNNEGCCIVLNKKKIDSSINELRESNGINFYDKKIMYKNDIPKIDFSLDANIPRFINDNLDYFLFTKFIDWQNEHEHRYVAYINSKLPNQDCFLPINNAIEGVYFGHKFPQILKEKVMEFFSNKDIFFTDISWENGICKKKRKYRSYKEYLSTKLRENFIGKLLRLNNNPSIRLSANHEILIESLLSMSAINHSEYDIIKNYEHLIYEDVNNKSNEEIKHLLDTTNQYFLLLIREKEKI